MQNNSNNSPVVVGQKMAFQKEDFTAADTPKSDLTTTTINDSPTQLTNLMLATNYDKDTPMNSSIASILDDSTPSDSGVHMLDSLSSSGMNESIMSNSGFDFDISTAYPQPTNYATSDQVEDPPTLTQMLPDLVLPAAAAGTNQQLISDLKNSNVEPSTKPTTATTDATTTDEMKTSTCSTFDQSDNIVYRRKTKKSLSHTSAGPKKRVSFHEDILKNTKTDNIRVEHGFITYKGYNSKKIPHTARYSWCSEGDTTDECNNKRGADGRPLYYRNACSDVLDYGKADCYETQQCHYDNSGVFEYGPPPSIDQQQLAKSGKFYKCHCSDSNSSLDSGDSCNGNGENRKRNYGQSKSSSCDCIGAAQGGGGGGAVVISIAENCYFSEPNIETLDDSFEHIQHTPKSVWSKEKKPKSSCLKKGGRPLGGVIIEQDISKKVKTFNVHQLKPDMNNLLDNSKIILGSLKNIFAMPLPERGVPEGCEDLQSVYECLPEVDNYSPVVNKQRPFLSKSFDGGLFKSGAEKPKKYIHNVDEQLRRKNVDASSSSPKKQEPDTVSIVTPLTTATPADNSTTASPNVSFRNKYIINCESTVFEHTGVSYETEENLLLSTPMVKSAMATQHSSALPNYNANPLRRKLSNILKSFRDATPTQPTPTTLDPDTKSIVSQLPANRSMESSVISNISSETTTASIGNKSSGSEAVVTAASADELTASPSKSKHLASPLRRKSMTTRITTQRLIAASPDKMDVSISESKCSLSEDFDDILTITTTSVDSEIVLLDYPSPEHQQQELMTAAHHDIGANNFLRPPSSKSSLINRFLRNVTQKKIHDATVKKNTFLAEKMRHERKPFGSIYVKGVRPKNPDLIEDLNAEIALEMELCGNSMASSLKMFSDRKSGNGNGSLVAAALDYGTSVGEIPVEVFKEHCLTFLRDTTERLMKIFKLYTGYSLEGHMTPVLVFLTDRTLYVTNMIRNRLINKFVLPYSELDVILIGPHGNTVLLSNGTRDMQQVLLAGGPYPADGLVSALEMCARRAGFLLPSVGLLTLDHLAPLQAFVRENSAVTKNEPWVYYAVVSVPTNLHQDEEPLGPNVKGPLMYQNVWYQKQQQPQNWRAGYFLLKAGVLYMFNDSQQKLPNMAIALQTECKGVRRALKSCRPHCFELMLKTGIIQLAAPDEYVASEWLQGLVQSASGLFEMQDRHKTLGCTLVLTTNHLITMHEDFTSPLRRINGRPNTAGFSARGSLIDAPSFFNRKLSSSAITTNEICNDTNSVMSNNSTRLSSDCHLSSNNSSPCRSNSGSVSTACNIGDENSFSCMSSIYGKNSGIEIKSCASLQELSTVRIPAQGDNWWCILEFSCQEVRECTDDMVIFFTTNSDMRRFLTMLETLWQTQNDTAFPITILQPTDSVGQHCSQLFVDINKSWDPLISAALGYPQ